MIRRVLQRVGQKALLVPIVALASYALMALLPLQVDAESKRALPKELLASYQRDLGLGDPLGFLRPWKLLFSGQRLGTSAQGVTGDELWTKLSGSLLVGALALGLALVWAAAFAAFRSSRLGRRSAALAELVPALAFGTPVFLPGLLLAPSVVEAGHLLPELAAALVMSVWPGIFLGRLAAQALLAERTREYVRTALGKGVGLKPTLWRHVGPNVVPVVLDALPPLATALLGGSFAAERVFGLPYFGQLYVLAVLERQVPVVVVATTVFASLLVAVQLAVELVRLAIDPRAREAAR